jgi:hypothetical protein
MHKIKTPSYGDKYDLKFKIRDTVQPTRKQKEQVLLVTAELHYTGSDLFLKLSQ